MAGKQEIIHPNIPLVLSTGAKARHLVYPSYYLIYFAKTKIYLISYLVSWKDTMLRTHWKMTSSTKDPRGGILSIISTFIIKVNYISTYKEVLGFLSDLVSGVLLCQL